MRTPDFFPAIFLAMLGCLVFLSGMVFLLWNIFITGKKNNQGGDDQDGDGGITWDVDAPLDLPPGIYTLPPEPVPQP